jgi:hemerythrin-like domain-containing protein
MKIWKRIAAAYRILFYTNTVMLVELEGNPLFKISEKELHEKINKVLSESFDFESEEQKMNFNFSIKAIVSNVLIGLTFLGFIFWVIGKLLIYFAS